MMTTSHSPSFEVRRRLAARRGERGAAIFVVVLVVSLLTALGIFAVKTATLSNRASGYSRQLMQTHHVTSLGVVGVAADLKETHAHVHYMLENVVPDPTTDAICEAFNDQTFPKCVLMSYDDLNLTPVSLNGVGLLAPSSGPAHGSLGVEPVNADLRVEITDPSAMDPPSGAQIAGGTEQTNTLQYALVTVTVTGVVLPPTAVASTNNFDTGSSIAAGIERQRAHVRIGPVLAGR